MSLVSGISSAEEMEGTLRAARIQAESAPTVENLKYYHDLLIAWRRRDWAIGTQLKYLKEVPYPPLEKAHTLIDTTVSDLDGITETGSIAKARYYTRLVLSLSDDTDFMTNHHEGIRVSIQNDTDILYQKTFRGVVLCGDQLVPGGANPYYFCDITRALPLIPLLEGETCTILLINWTGVQLASMAGVFYYREAPF
jgi:hypothetical protein